MFYRGAFQHTLGIQGDWWYVRVDAWAQKASYLTLQSSVFGPDGAVVITCILPLTALNQCVIITIIVGVAGGLTALSKMPACNIQVSDKSNTRDHCLACLVRTLYFIIDIHYKSLTCLSQNQVLLNYLWIHELVYYFVKLCCKLLLSYL